MVKFIKQFLLSNIPKDNKPITYAYPTTRTIKMVYAAMKEVQMENDLEMMKKGDWSVLPIKRDCDKNPKNPMGIEVGFLLPTTGSKVYMENMFNLTPSTDLNKIITKTYFSFEEIVKDGWIVD